MIKKILIYGLGIFFSKLIVFLLIPLYTRCFTPADYGYYDVLTGNLTMVVSISFIEIWSGILRFMFDDESHKYSPIKTFLVILPALLVLYGLAFFALSYIMELKYVLLSVLYGLSYLLFTVFNIICRGLNHNIDYVVSGAISAALSSGLGVLFVVGLDYGIQSLLVAQIIGYMCAVIYVEIRTHAVFRAFKEHTSKAQIKQMVIYSLPLMINSFSFLFLGTYNKNIVINRLGETESGYYAFVLKFTSILSIAISVFSLAWQEVAFKNATSATRDDMYTYYMNVFIKFIGLVIPLYCAVLYFFAPIFGGSEFVVAVKYIPLAVMATFVSETSGVLGIVITVSKKGIHILISTVIGACVNILFSTFMIPIWGINAASIGLLMGFFCAAVYRFIIGHRLFKIKLKIIPILITCAEMAGVVLAYYFAPSWVIGILLAAVAAVWIVFNLSEIKMTALKFSNKIKALKASPDGVENKGGDADSSRRDVSSDDADQMPADGEDATVSAEIKHDTDSGFEAVDLQESEMNDEKT